MDKTAEEILATWDEDREWYAVDRLVGGHSLRQFVGDKAEAQAKAVDLISDDGSFCRCLPISSEDAKAYFEQCVHPSAWMPRWEAMDLLGINKSRMSQLVQSGQIASNGKLVSRADVEQRKALAPKAGQPRKPQLVTIYKCTVTMSREIGEEEGHEYYSLRPFGPNDDMREGFDDGGCEYVLPTGCTLKESKFHGTTIAHDGEFLPLYMNEHGDPAIVIGRCEIVLQKAKS